MTIKGVLLYLLACTLFLPFTNEHSRFIPLIQNNPFFQGSTPQDNSISPVAKKGTKSLVAIQRKINKQLSNYIKAIKEGNNTILMLSLLLAAFYGIVHALGPGHRKVVLFSYFATHHHPFKLFLISSFSTALLHAISAILVTSILYITVQKTISAKVDNVTKTTQQITWLFLALFGLAIIIWSIISLLKNKTKIEEKKSAKNVKLFLLVFFSGIIPCPAASTIMIICLQQQIAWLGILLVISLSLGMGITVFVTALPGFLSSKGVVYLTAKKEKSSAILAPILEIGSGLFLLIFSLIMLL